MALLLLPAAAQAGISPDQLRISADTDIDVFPVAATSTTGESIVVWTERGGATSILRFRRVHPDGSSGPPATISDATLLPVQRVVSVAPDGRALVVWSESTNGTAPLFLRGRWIEADGSMGPQLTLRDAVAAASSAGSPAVAATTDGDAVVAWRNALSTPTGRVEARRVDATGSLGTLLQPTQGPGSSTVEVAPALGGAALLAWTGDPASIWTLPVTAAGAAGAVQTPVVGDVIATPRLSTNGFDDFHLLFAPINIPTDQITTLAIGPTGVATGTRQTLESGATQAGFPQLATDVTGRSLALWTRDGTIAAGRFIGPDGVPDPTTLTAPAEQQSGQTVAMLGDGSGVLLWSQGPSGGARALWSRLVGPGAAAAAPVQLGTGDGSSTRVSVSPTGVGLIAWEQRDGGLTGPIRVAARQILPPPVCADAAATVVQGRPTRVPLACTGLQLTGPEVLTKTAHGTLGAVDAATASVLYTPAPGFQGNDAFTFRGAGKGGLGAT